MALNGIGTAAARSSRNIAVACQLSMFGLQVILPAVVRFTVGRRDPFVREWASEALNLQLIWVGVFLLLGAAAVRTQSHIVGYGTLVIFGVMGMYAVACGVTGARKAWRGELWRYPLNVRLFSALEEQ